MEERTAPAHRIDHLQDEGRGNRTLRAGGSEQRDIRGGIRGEAANGRSDKEEIERESAVDSEFVDKE